jgi:D-cysteine desulfhydrase
MTGAELSGNKVRKLELLLAEAEAQGADTLVTCGGLQSNHCRATALVAARRGLASLLFLRTADPAQAPAPEGNVLLDRLAGAELRLITPEQYRARHAVMAGALPELRAAGRSGYVIPEGGSSALGSLGYALCVSELCAQLDPGPLTMVCAVGSGGTLAGLALGAALSRRPWRVCGFAVCDDSAYFTAFARAILEEAGRLPGLAAAARAAASLFEVRDGYVGRGYGLARPEELALLRDACRLEGLVLDPVYTGKALYGLVSELRKDVSTFGPRVLFLHTGGIFGTMHRGAELAPLL